RLEWRGWRRVGGEWAGGGVAPGPRGARPAPPGLRGRRARRACRAPAARPPAGGRADRRRTGAPVSPPPLLLGAGLIFWGWQTGFLFVAVPLAVLIEAARALTWRLGLSFTRFHPGAGLCPVVVVRAFVYPFSH